MTAFRPRLHLTIVGAAALLAMLAACTRVPENPPTVLIGVDGAEWDVIDDMLADGELPNLARIRREGAWGHLLNPGPSLSPVVWTTFATGHFGRLHGILDHVFPYAPGHGKRPVTSELRQVPALWNIASHYGQRPVVVGYFVTYPAEPIDGVIVSPYAQYRIPGSLWPPDALDLDSSRFRELDRLRVQKRLWSRFLNWDFEPTQASDPDSPYQHAANVVVQRRIDKRIVADEFLHRAALQLAREPSDLFIGYYRLTDFMSHSLWIFYDDSDFAHPADPAEQVLFGESLRESYRYMDEAIGELLSQWGGRANVLIVSDHGFGSSLSMERGKRTRSFHLTGNHRPLGIMLAAGPDIQPGEFQGMTALDVAPTLLALLGLPVADELPGEVADELLRPGFLAEHPLRTTASYADVEVSGNATVLDRQTLAEDMNALRGLGYIGGDVELAGASQPGGYDFWSADDRTVLRIVASEVTYHLLKGNQEAAQAAHDLLADRRPDLGDRLARKIRSRYLAMTAQLPKEHLNPEAFERYLEDRGAGRKVSGEREKKRAAGRKSRQREPRE